jgi:O-antigen biosynthesis protein WbqP
MDEMQRVFLMAEGSAGSGKPRHFSEDDGGSKLPEKSKLYWAVKRGADIVLSLIAIVVLLIPMIIIALVIKADSKGPVFFKQRRIGKNQELFYCYKFRTMKVDAPKDCPPYLFKNPEDYITKVGSVLRKTSLDELPQLINILKGEMTLVGPRPCTPKEVDLIKKREAYGIFELTPGLTGWAQVNGRDEISIRGKVKRDREYALYASVGFDLKILWLTFIKVLKREGVHEGQNEKNVIR